VSIFRPTALNGEKSIDNSDYIHAATWRRPACVVVYSPVSVISLCNVSGFQSIAVVHYVR